MPRPVAPARLAAFRILLAIARSATAHSDDLLHTPDINRLSLQDRQLATMLVMGVLRWQISLDTRIRPALTRTAKLDDAVAVALQLGAFQLLFLDRIPAHAAIHDSVELAKRAGHRFASRMVNAVLRRLAAAPRTEHDPVAGHPAWLIARWSSLLSPEQLQALCAYDQTPAPTVMRFTHREAERELQAAGFGFSPGVFLSSARTVIRGDFADARQLATGQLRMQDEGSQLIAELAGTGKRILDCCAAPGGKTAILAERNPHADIIACDISTARVRQMRENFACSPQTARIQCIEADATTLPQNQDVPGLFDLILCDAPCSGTGTLAHNPEIKLRLQLGDLERQQARQGAILAAVAQKLAPGGRLIYSTCSLEPEENEQVVQRLLATYPELEKLSIEQSIAALDRQSVLLPGAAALLTAKGVQNGCLRTLPGTLPCDGFFAAVLTRNSE